MIKMTMDFAETIAGVAPVVLLVATVEMARLAPGLKAVGNAPSRDARVIAGLYADGVAPNRGQVLDVHRRLSASEPTKARRAAVLAYYLSATLICMALFVAEMVAINYIADPSVGPEPGMAKFCRDALVTGFFWTVTAPLLTAVWIVRPQGERATAEDYALAKRFRREVRRLLRESSEESHEATDQSPSTP
jgi:hypothetical protein